MAINHDAIGTVTDMAESSWNSSDCLLYALAVGAGSDDPTDPAELPFTTENTTGVPQEVLPSFALVVPVGPGSPLDALGDFDRAMMVNGEQQLVLHRSLPVEGRIRGRTRIAAMHDKGSGALVVFESEATDAATDEPMWTVRTGVFIRGEGGWGGDRGSSPAGPEPDRAPDHAVTYRTHPEQALLYRLTGDRTPLHSDPEIAGHAGFGRPILHGKCTLGFAARALLHTVCRSDPARFRSIEARFSRPVIPGEELTISIWVTRGGEATFRATTGTGTVVLDAGRCAFS